MKSSKLIIIQMLLEIILDIVYGVTVDAFFKFLSN